MAVQIVNVIPNADKPHVLEVELLDEWTEMEPSADGKTMVPVTRTYAKNIPVRKSKFESLTATGKMNYALECMEYHHPTRADGAQKRAARRAKWDADDKAAEEAKWKAEPVGKSEDGTKVKVHVVHGGFAVTVEVPADAADPAQAIKDAWAVAKTEHDATQAELAAFSI